MEKIYNLLGLCSKGVILSHFESIKNKVSNIVMEAITEEEEQAIDETLNRYGEIRFVKDNDNVILAKDIFLYGLIDFNDENDIQNIIKFNLIDLNSNFNYIYSTFNFDTCCFTTINGVAKRYPTYNALKWFMYNYVLLGKPERIIIYKKHL